MSQKLEVKSFELPNWSIGVRLFAEQIGPRPYQRKGSVDRRLFSHN